MNELMSVGWVDGGQTQTGYRTRNENDLDDGCSILLILSSCDNDMMHT